MINDVDKILEVCFEEFCDYIGDGVCGCDACPYVDYGDKCYEKYREDKFIRLKEKK